MNTPTWDRVFSHIDGNTGRLREWVVAVVAKKPPRLHDQTGRPKHRFLYLYSDQNGTGRSILHEALSLLIPERVIRIDPVLSSRCFNAELATPFPVCVIEETHFGRDRTALSRFKDWVTLPEIVVHRQCQAPITVPNTASWVQCGRNPQDCPARNPDLGVDFLRFRVPSLRDPVPKTILHEQLRAEAPAFLESILQPC